MCKRVSQILACVILTLSSTVSAEVKGDSISIQRDIVYENLGQRKLHLDLYQVKGSTKTQPLVIWIHGGGWSGGSKKLHLKKVTSLLAKGFAVASVEYRLSGEAIFPAAVTDCKAAVRFLRANAKKFNLDSEKFGVWGSSAGGHLAAFLGTSGDVKEFDVGSNLAVSSRVQAVCDWYGPSDFLKMNDGEFSKMNHFSSKSPESRFLGGPIQEIPEVVKKANPATYVTKDDPPFSIMHGGRDSAVVYNQSEILEAALKEQQIEVTLHKIKGQGHGFRGKALINTVEMTVDFFSETFDVKE
ncbi:MAG: alpha/beta hydrolase [Lentisphaeraceae bacterium]|nr:alpha/beta hydrolase [Lentisphaeraceae bacterium]